MLMDSKKRVFAVGSFYHIMTKSIAGYQIFRFETDYERMLQIMQYYSYEDVPIRFSYYKRLKDDKHQKKAADFDKLDKLVDIISYCLMPTHIHLLLTPLKENGISLYMKNLLNSYTRYFNTRNNRKGPLWQSRFKDVIVENDEQLLHLTRYIHLNPTTSGFVDKPEDWKYSSYNEFIGENKKHICKFNDYLDIDPKIYKEFVESRIDEQKELAFIKSLALE
jgi:putative transposase